MGKVLEKCFPSWPGVLPVATAPSAGAGSEGLAGDVVRMCLFALMSLQPLDVAGKPLQGVRPHHSLRPTVKTVGVSPGRSNS